MHDLTTAYSKRKSGLGLVGLITPALCIMMYLSGMAYWIIGIIFTEKQISSAASTRSSLSSSQIAPQIEPYTMPLRTQIAFSFTFFSINVSLFQRRELNEAADYYE